MQIVELDVHGFCLARRPMEAETSATVWLGGVCILLPEEVCPEKGEALQDLLGRVGLPACEDNICLWHLPGIPVGISKSRPVSRWERMC